MEDTMHFMLHIHVKEISGSDGVAAGVPLCCLHALYTGSQAFPLLAAGIPFLGTMELSSL
jgi:hypothetical protein